MKKVTGFIFRTIGKFWVMSYLIKTYRDFMSGRLSKRVRYTKRLVDEMFEEPKSKTYNKFPIGFESE